MRARACARSWRRTPSATGATCWPACSRSSTTYRAIDAANAKKTQAPDPLLQGVEMVRQQFLSKLEGFGVTRIQTDGAMFDPLVHEAVTTVPGEAASDGRVAGVIAQGYRIGDEVLRPALVAVSKA